MNDSSWKKALKYFGYTEFVSSPDYWTWSGGGRWAVRVCKGDSNIRADGETLIEARGRAVFLIREREALRVGDEARKAREFKDE